MEKEEVLKIEETYNAKHHFTMTCDIFKSDNAFAFKDKTSEKSFITSVNIYNREKEPIYIHPEAFVLVLLAMTRFYLNSVPQEKLEMAEHIILEEFTNKMISNNTLLMLGKNKEINNGK